jgi:hypothetical protein
MEKQKDSPQFLNNHEELYARSDYRVAIGYLMKGMAARAREVQYFT